MTSKYYIRVIALLVSSCFNLAGKRCVKVIAYTVIDSFMSDLCLCLLRALIHGPKQSMKITL